MNKLKCKSDLQLVLDEDINVPDIKPDIMSIIKEQGNIKIEDVEISQGATTGRLMVKGTLVFNILYLCGDEHRPVHNITGKIPFDEMINMEEDCSGEDPVVTCILEDLTVGLINSRKLNVKSIISLSVAIEETYDEETAIGIEEALDIEHINKKIEITSVAVSKKDIYRIKDEVQLPSSKNNISEILYEEVNINSVEIRLLEDKISLKGVVPIFVLYSCDDEEAPMDYFDGEVPFSAIIDCNGCSEEMIENINFTMISKEIQIKKDSDGEDRMIDLEIVLDLNIKIYGIHEPEILYDIYSPTKEIMPIIREAEYENLLIKNNSKYKISDQIIVEDKSPRILQICHAAGNIKIDNIVMNKDGLEVEGVIEVGILYISEDDTRPINAYKGIVHFIEEVEVKGIEASSIYDIKPSIDKLSVMMLDGQEIEIKAVINLNTIVFEQITERIITDIEVEELDAQKLQGMPGVIGYIAKDGDTLWGIAKANYTTREVIKNINNMEKDTVNKGDKLIIMKKVDFEVIKPQ